MIWMLNLGMLVGAFIAWRNTPAEQKSPQKDAAVLTDLEHTKLELALEKQKTNSAQAALIRKAYEENQAQGKQLQDEAKALSDATCTAHGIAPADCEYAPDGLSVHQKVKPKK
jgi:hypothetical protein